MHQTASRDCFLWPGPAAAGDAARSLLNGKMMKQVDNTERWKPGDCSENFLRVYCTLGETYYWKFSSKYSQAIKFVEDLLEKISPEEKDQIKITVYMSVWTKNGGKRNIAIGKWNPNESVKIEKFMKECFAKLKESK